MGADSVRRREVNMGFGPQPDTDMLGLTVEDYMAIRADSEQGKKLGEKLLQEYGVDCGVSIEKYGDRLIYGSEFMHVVPTIYDAGFQAGVESAKKELIAKIEEKRVVFCQGCLRKKPLVRPASSSSIVGGAGIHTPEGWVCVTDLVLEALGIDVASLSLQGRKQENEN